MKKSHFLAALMISRMTGTLPEVLLLLTFSWLVFGVVVQGSLLAVALLILLGAVMFSGIGLLVASRARTLEAVSGLMNFVMLPMWIFSGVFFSAERFPAMLQPFIQALPLTAVVNALRANMLEGAGFLQYSSELAIVTAWLGASFLSALALFRWR